LAGILHHGYAALSTSRLSARPFLRSFSETTRFDEIWDWEFILKIIKRFSFGSYLSNINPTVRGAEVRLYQSSQTPLIIQTFIA
jgi:hypothetical protein